LPKVEKDEKNLEGFEAVTLLGSDQCSKSELKNKDRWGCVIVQ
jgi:hypothetical protein